MAPNTITGVTVDTGVTHVALPVTDLAASLEFYEKYFDADLYHRQAAHDQLWGDH